MAQCIDSINHCSPEQVKIPYHFYNDYISNKNFLEIFKKRKLYIRDKFVFKEDDDALIKEYFVEIFSWSVFNKTVLTTINKYLTNHNINCIIDPCCGNAFHTFLLKEVKTNG